MNVDFPIKRVRSIRASHKAFLNVGGQKPPVYDGLPRSDMFRFPPNNEEATIVNLAGFLAPFLGWRAKTIQEAFPDATYVDVESGKDIRVEFEKVSHDFISHKHDPNGCDYILCWEDNFSREERTMLLKDNPELKVIEIKRIFHQYDFDFM